MAKKEFPEWAKILYRGVRAGISAGLVAIMALKLDLSDPKEAVKLVAITFGTAFIVALGKWARDLFDKWFGWDEKSIFAKVLPI
jgi:ABC-type transport system involved in cytochrome c biogenesis permease subunit